MKFYKNFKAFTLSEILISLTIIGIISAITIPIISSIIDDNQYKAALKKNYSNLSNAINLAYGFNYDDFKDWNYKNNELAFTTEIAEKLFNYLHVQKICGHSSGCFAAPIYAKNGSLGVNDFVTAYEEAYSFILNDGTSVILVAWSDSNAISFLGFNQETLFGLNANLSIIVDVNGLKKPNKSGKDIFLFMLTPKGLLPAGADNKSKYCNNTHYWYNFSCTYTVLYDNM